MISKRLLTESPPWFTGDQPITGRRRRHQPESSALARNGQGFFVSWRGVIPCHANGLKR